MTDFEIPHIDLPPRFEGGRLAYVEQDSVDEVANAVECVLRYRPGDRPDVSNFGTPAQTFKQGGADAEEIEGAIAEWEPRAQAAVDADLDPIDIALSRVGVEVTGAGG